MASLNPLTRELVFKIVFYGPGLGGKTTTLQHIHAATKPENRGNLVSLATPTDRTLYFDFLPIRVPRIRTMNIRLQLFTVPGQVYFSATRKLVLTGADGIVFVADSQSQRADANQESLEDLNANLAEHGRALSQISHVFQWNKRDLAGVVPSEELDRRFNLFSAPSLGTVAVRGDGVFDVLGEITKRVVAAYRAELPVSSSREVEAKFEAATDGLGDAIRGLTEAPDEAEGPTTKVLGSGSNEALLAATQRPATAPPRSVPRGPHPEADLAQATRLGARAEHAPVSISHVLPTSRPPGEMTAVLGFSLAELWPEGEREGVRRVETLIAKRQVANAVLACDLLMARVLASAAGLAGSLEAPRDPGLVCLLMGLDGRRYLQFRSTVRAARQGEDLTLRTAMDCFTFVLEARRARDAI